MQAAVSNILQLNELIFAWIQSIEVNLSEILDNDRIENIRGTGVSADHQIQYEFQPEIHNLKTKTVSFLEFYEHNG